MYGIYSSCVKAMFVLTPSGGQNYNGIVSCHTVPLRFMSHRSASCAQLVRQESGNSGARTEPTLHFGVEIFSTPGRLDRAGSYCGDKRNGRCS